MLTLQSLEETETLVRLAMGAGEGGAPGAGMMRFDDPVNGFAADLDGILDDSDLLSSFISDDFAVPGGLAALGLPPGEEPEFTSADFKSL